MLDGDIGRILQAHKMAALFEIEIDVHLKWTRFNPRIMDTVRALLCLRVKICYWPFLPIPLMVTSLALVQTYDRPNGDKADIIIWMKKTGQTQ